jgi:hypothetical protein
MGGKGWADGEDEHDREPGFFDVERPGDKGKRF